MRTLWSFAELPAKGLPSDADLDPPRTLCILWFLYASCGNPQISHSEMIYTWRIAWIFQVYIYIYLSLSLSIYLSIYLSIDLSIYRSIDLSIYRSIYLSIYCRIINAGGAPFLPIGRLLNRLQGQSIFRCDSFCCSTSFVSFINTQ